MAIVRIPSLLRGFTHGQAQVQVEGHNLRQVVSALDEAYPGIGARLLDEGNLRPELALSVDGELTSTGLLQAVGEDSEVVILPAISGG